MGKPSRFGSAGNLLCLCTGWQIFCFNPAADNVGIKRFLAG
ncbi:hypothetical protein CHISP_2661 [Chitinispirillum alkaliphilum]|nr:hypothetical protein CHISP_2661 [Chitinispirillum alkaliphilum]